MNRFNRRQLQNQYTPMSLQEMTFLPGVKTQAHQSAIASSIAMKNMPYQASPYTNDGQITGQVVQDFEKSVDSFVDSSLKTGLNPNSNIQMKGLVDKYGVARKYVDATNNRAASFAGMQKELAEASAKNPEQSGWADDIMKYNMAIAQSTELNLDPNTGDYNGFQFQSYIERPDISKKLEESFSNIITSSAYGPLQDNAEFGKLQYETMKYKEREAMVASLYEIANDPAVRDYLQTAKRIYGAEFMTGLEGGKGGGISAFSLSYDEKTNKMNEPVFNGNTLLGSFMHKAYAGHKGTELDIHYMDYGKGKSGNGTIGGLNAADVMEFEAVGVQSNAGQNSASNSYDALNNTIANDAKVVEETNTKYDTEYNRTMPTMKAALVTTLGLPDATVAGTYIDNIIEVLSTNDAFKNDANADPRTKLQEYRTQLEEKGIPSNVIDNLITNASPQMLSNFGTLSKYKTVLRETKANLDANTRSLNDLNKALAVAIPKGSPAYEAQIGYQNNVAEITRTLREWNYAHSPVRDEAISTNRTYEDVDNLINKLEEDLKGVPYSALAYADENGVSIDQAQKVIVEQVFSKYKNDFNLDEYMAENQVTQIARNWISTLDYAADRAFGWLWVADDPQAETDAGTDDSFIDGLNNKKPSRTSGADFRTHVSGLKRNLSVYSSALAATGLIKAEQYNSRTTALNLTGHDSDKHPFGRELKNLLGVMAEQLNANQNNILIQGYEGLTLAKFVNEATGVDKSTLKKGTRVHPSIYYDSKTHRYEQGMIVTGTAVTPGGKGKEVDITVPVKMTDANGISIGDMHDKLYQIWLGESQFQMASGKPRNSTSLDALNNYYGQQVMDYDEVEMDVLNTPKGESFTLNANYYGEGDTKHNAAGAGPLVSAQYKITHVDNKLWRVTDMNDNPIRDIEINNSNHNSAAEAIMGYLGETLGQIILTNRTHGQIPTNSSAAADFYGNQ